jgi:predicted anti-sigma-YlaC factor YlaD
MHCNTCKENLEAYMNGRLPDDMMRSMKAHLNECADCKVVYTALLLSEKMIKEESLKKPNPFLATRVMAKIEALERITSGTEKAGVFSRIWQPVFITISLALAIFIGIIAGNLYRTARRPGQIPEELVYLNDAAMESLSVLMNE